MLGTYALSAGYYDAYYLKAQKVRLYRWWFWKAISKVDAIIGPTSPTTALPLGATQGQAMFGELEDMLMEPSISRRLPGASIPCGFADGLPIGIQITLPNSVKIWFIKLPGLPIPILISPPKTKIINLHNNEITNSCL